MCLIIDSFDGANSLFLPCVSPALCIFQRWYLCIVWTKRGYYEKNRLEVNRKCDRTPKQSSKEILKDEVHINHTYKNYEISKNHRKRFVAVRLFTIKRHIKPKRKNRYLMGTLAYQYRGTGSIPVLSITSGLRCLWFSPLNSRCFCRLTAFLPSTKVNYPNSKETVTKKSYFVNARGLIWFILMLYQKCSIYKSRASVSLTKYSVICKW